MGVIIILWYVMPCFQVTWGMSAERKRRRLRINPGALQLAKSRSLGRLRRKGRKRERDKGAKGRSSVSKAAVGHTRHESSELTTRFCNRNGSGDRDGRGFSAVLGIEL